MVNRLFIFGNGLGRSVSNEFFQLEVALRSAWNNPAILTDHQKELIISCLPPRVLEDEDPTPTSEPDLEDLQRVLSACETIKVFEGRLNADQQNWLTDAGLEFPSAIRRYIHQSACHFHQRDILQFEDVEPELPAGFCTSLRQSIMDHGAHVATLNYDDLLYEAFTGTEVFQRHRLRDGFFGGRFDFERHERLLDRRNEGWFLHLHGSPLFVDQNESPSKITRAELAQFAGAETTHLVLTSVRFKRAIIEASEILSKYWAKLEEIGATLNSLVLFGYGGLDTHLNEYVARLPESIRIRVVEREDEEELIARQAFWREKLIGRDVELIRLPDILAFDDW